MKCITHLLGFAACAGLCLVLICADTWASTAVKVDLETDWKNQYDDLNNQLQRQEWFAAVAEQAFRKDALILKSDRKPSDVALRRTEALLADISTRIEPGLHRDFEAKLKAIRQRVNSSGATTGSEEDRALFNDISRLRRDISFANPLLDFDKIVFLKHRFSAVHHSCSQYYGGAAFPGGGVYTLSRPFSAQPELKNLLADAKVKNGRLGGQKLDETGSFMSLALSYDASTLFFAYTQCDTSVEDLVFCARDDLTIRRQLYKRAWTPEASWHIFSASADGSGLEQLTDGTHNDFDPYPLPNGRLVFLSERRGGFGRCHGGPMPAYVLHSMRTDGSDIVPLSYHETNEWHPSVNNDGMIIYSRWDYVDRGDCIAHHPWITYPDGRDPRAIQGNYPIFRQARPDMELHVRAIPGSHKYVSTAAGHHRLAYGSLIIIDPRVEDDGAMAPIKRLTPDVCFPESEEHESDYEKRKQNVYMYGTAWPLSELYHLAVYTPGGRESLGIYLIDAFGNRELLYRDPGINCLHPLPFRPRKTPPVIPHATAVGLPDGIAAPDRGESQKQETGTITCMNVYDSLKPWPDGTKIEKLRIIQLFPKTTPSMNDPLIGIAPESLARGVLGTVPIEEDGSVRFTAPAGKTIYFQALDEDGLAVQSMMSATYVHPGEQLTCQGCHERKLHAPAQPAKPRLALRRPPSELKPDVEGTYPLSFPRLVQPVLDKNCVPCHQKDKTKKAPDLTGAVVQVKLNKEIPRSPEGLWPVVEGDHYPGNYWSHSYLSLQSYAYGRSGKPPGGRGPVRTTPGDFGAQASKLYQMLKRGHHDLKLSDEDMHRITVWLDCNSNFYGAYHDTEKQAEGERVMPTLE